MSTLEMLIAFGVFTLCLAAIILLAFGDEALIVDAEASGPALSLAQKMLEEERALARQDFRLANSTTTVVEAGPLVYNASVAVSQSDFFTKQATSTVTWESAGRPFSVELATILTDSRSLSDDTCSSIVTGDWTRPALTSVPFLDLIATSTGPYPISDVNAYRGKLYVSVARTPYKTDPTFFIFDIADPAHPVLLGTLDNAPANTGGLAAVRIVEDRAASVVYAFAASASSFASGQLQVFDVTGAARPRVLVTYKIPLTHVPSAGLGNALAYRDGYVYLGLTSTSGDEFDIINVQDPSAPVWVGGYASGGHDVNAIAISGHYAYVASPAAQEVTVLNIAVPASPQYVAGFNAPVGGGNGKSLYAIGTSLFLGKTAPNAGPEYYKLNIADPSAIQSANADPLTKETGSSINGLVTRDFLSFVLTNAAFTVVSATSTAQLSSVALPASGSAYEPSMDCEGNAFYAASNDAGNNGSLSVITTP
ncbi:TPA: hypothetical protein DIV48_02930 [Candidatus Kaiserbacteria bacterium]|nr:MAG: hypothetical protein UY93_C0002G0316 [Parcubacteria group bacterium GW2011_GWA1_56_13]KKW46403.1 MAG: hypothetical protein UY97_C0006G0007 [Parcubacteria group bacterium GW2011_GWB1_57_6]HCR52576.1 hypothetical protein [Candidatus Kaiserbacteria bacterium]